MRAWFENLAPREQILVSLAGVLTVIVVVYLAIWLPLDRGSARLESRVEDQRNLIAELRQLQGRVSAPASAGSSTAGASSGQSLVVIVDSTVRQKGLGTALKRSQPTDGNAIRVVFENAPFDTLIEWLGQLSSQHGIEIESASFSNRAERGRVDSTLTLERTL